MKTNELIFTGIVALATIAILARGTGPRETDPDDELSFINYDDIPQKRGAIMSEKLGLQ